MITVTRDIESPPGGWKFTVAETGVVVTAPYFKILKSRVRAHLVANNLPVADDFDSWLADAACKENSLGTPFCGQPAPAQVAGALPYLTMAMAARFLKTMLGVIQSRKFVTREEAERRAAICVRCPLNQKIAGCGACNSLLRKVEKVMLDYPLNPELEWCAACGCRLSVKAWVPNSILDKAEGSDRPLYAPGCWRNEDN